MKVLYCITRSDWGGAQVHLYDIVSEMSKEGHSCEVIVGEKGILYEKLQQNEVKVYHVPTLVHSIKPVTDLRAIVDLFKLIKKINPDIVHLHSTKAGWLGRISAFLARKKTIFTAHGWCFTEGASTTNRRIVGIMIEKCLAPVTSKIICVSEYDRKLALKCRVATPEKLVTVYNGVKKEETIITNPPHIFLKNSFKVIMVARFSEQKDYRTLIEATRLLGKDVDVICIGDGELLIPMKALAAELSLNDRVHFLGHQEDVQSLLALSDIFVLSSKYEGLPISIIEAMKAGLPIIASDVGGIGELVIDEENGYLFKSGDVKGLATKIELLKNGDLRERMHIKSRNYFKQKFTLETCVEATKNVYYETLKKKY